MASVSSLPATLCSGVWGPSLAGAASCPICVPRWLWTGAPDRVLAGIRPVLNGLKSPGQAIFCGPLLTLGMRACADLAEQARAAPV